MAVVTPLEVQVNRDRPQAAVVAVRGEIDLTSAPRLREALIPEVEQGTTVLELSGVDFCDSSGLRVLVEAGHTARDGGTSLRLAAVSPAVMQVLELVSAVEFFALFPDVETALKD